MNYEVDLEQELIAAPTRTKLNELDMRARHIERSGFLAGRAT
jgi:hypothetical protein